MESDELWQQHKQLKTMEMSETRPNNTMRDIFITSNLNLLTKFTSSRINELKGTQKQI